MAMSAVKSAVKIVHHQREAKRTVIKRCLHFGIGLVKAAHETKLDQVAARLCLGINHLQAFGRRL
jgi:hypothetical protein